MKKLYKCPDKRDLITGAVVDIYVDYKERKNFEGFAELIEKVDCRVPEAQRVYVRIEIGTNKKQAPHTVIWSYERWKVKFINSNFITVRNIAYFVAVNNYQESGIS